MALTTALVLIQGGKVCAEDSALKSRKARNPVGFAGPKGDSSISYQTLQGGTKVADKGVPRDKDEIVPVSNITIPDSIDASDGVPAKRDFVIYRLKRRVAELRNSELQLLNKLTRVLTLLVDEKRYFDIGLHHGHWETYDQLTARRLRIVAAIDLIQDPTANPVVIDEKQKGIL